MNEWNVYLDEGPRYYRLIMPDSQGQYTDPVPTSGFAVKWPINPHFTGARMIARMLLLAPSSPLSKPIKITIGDNTEIIRKGDGTN